MDYKEKYKEALERATQLSKQGGTHKYLVCKIFPELKKSEDEKIRKCIHDLIKENTFSNIYGVTKKECLAWLEKQYNEPNWCHHKVDLANCSEEYRKAYYDGWNNCNMQHSQCESEKSDVLKCLINGMKFYYEDNKEATWGTEKFSMKVKDILSWLERQGEQNSTDKVEPKFHLGDWIIHQGTENIYQVVAIIDNQYQLKYGDNYTIQKCVDVDRCARLWDISKDEKKPYVISTNRELLSLQHEVIGWLEDHKQFAAKDDIQYIQDCIEKIRAIQLPQWNPDDKKMEKIKQINAWSEKDDINLGKAIWYVENPAPMVVKGSMLVEWLKSLKNRVQPQPKQDWSKKDEEKQKAIIGILDYQANISEDRICATNGYIVDDLIAWLKSIKPQPKQEWSEEDERNLKGIIDEIEANKNQAPDYDLATYDRFLSWLKSIKDRVGCEVNCTTTKQWSKEDEYQINTILHGLDLKRELYKKEGNKVEEERYNTQYKWLKSLKNRVQPQNTWKPSDEQMDVLLSEVTAWTKGCPKQIVLESLYNDLKKLKEK